AGDGDFADGVGELSIFNPEAGRAARVIAGDAVDAHADKLGDVEALADILHQLLRRKRAGGHVEIRRRRRGRAAGTARGVTGGDETELTRGSGVEQPRGEAALVDEDRRAIGDALAVERLGA